jgi:hypothetical protein
LGDLKYQQCFDILEAYAYTKKGSIKAISSTLEALQDNMYAFNDIDQAIVLANALVEINPTGDKKSTDFKRMQKTRLDILQ